MKNEEVQGAGEKTAKDRVPAAKIDAKKANDLPIFCLRSKNFSRTEFFKKLFAANIQDEYCAHQGLEFLASSKFHRRDSLSNESHYSWNWEQK